MDNNEYFKSILDNLFDGVYLVDRNRRILYWNKGAQRITGFANDEVEGHHCFNNILNHVNQQGEVMCFGKCPLAFTMEDGQPREAEIFLHHRDGHRVPVVVRVSPVRDADGNITGAVETFSDNSSKINALEKVAELQRRVWVDPLTGVGNRHYTQVQLEHALAGLREQNMAFGVLFIDVDFFKKVNDRFGHAGGDQVLRMIAATLSSNVKPFDFIGRWGGEEFLAIIVNADAAHLREVAESLLRLVENSSVRSGPVEMNATISIGASIARPDDTPDSLVDRADRAMYQSKADGRNRVTEAAND